MQIVIETKKDCHNIQCHDLSGGTRTVSPTFEIDNNWHNVIIPTSRKNIRRILIGGVDIHMMLNSGEQNDNAYSIWLHGDIGQMKERIHDCIDQDDLLSFTNLKAKYLHTVSKGIDAPQYLPYHVRKFFSRGDGPLQQQGQSSLQSSRPINRQGEALSITGRGSIAHRSKVLQKCKL